MLTDAAPLPGSDPAYSDIEDAYSNTLIVSGAATKAEEGISKFLHMTNHHDKRDVALSDALKKSNFGDEGHPWVDARVVNKAVNTALKDAQKAETEDKGVQSRAAKETEVAAHDIEEAEYAAQKKEAELTQVDKQLARSFSYHTGNGDIKNMNTNSATSWEKRDFHRMREVARDLDVMGQRQNYADADVERVEPRLKNVN